MQTAPCIGMPVRPIRYTIESPPKRRRKPTLEEIYKDIRLVFDHYPPYLKGRTKSAVRVLIIRTYCYVAKEQTGRPDKEIAALIGKDRTTALYHYQTARNYLKIKDPTGTSDWDYYLGNSKLFTTDDFK